MGVKTLIIKDARDEDYEAFKNFKSENGYTDAGTIMHLLKLIKSGALAELTIENEELREKNGDLTLQVEMLTSKESVTEGEISNLKSLPPKIEIKETTVTKEVEKKLLTGQFIVSTLGDLQVHIRKARPFIKKDMPLVFKSDNYESDLAVFCISKFLNKEYSRIK